MVYLVFDMREGDRESANTKNTPMWDGGSVLVFDRQREQGWQGVSKHKKHALGVFFVFAVSAGGYVVALLKGGPSSREVVVVVVVVAACGMW